MDLFGRLEQYTETQKLEAIKDIIVKMMVEVLGVFAIMMKEIKEGRASESISDETFSVTDRALEKYFKKFITKLKLRGDRIEDALSRMDGLTGQDVATAIAQIRSTVTEPLLTGATNTIPSDPGPLLTAAALIASSSSKHNLEAIFAASLVAYEEKTKESLRTHPLMAKLQTCNTPDDTLALLRTQFGKFEKSTSDDIKWTKWLKPIVHVLYGFSDVIGGGVGLVNLIRMIHLRSIL